MSFHWSHRNLKFNWKQIIPVSLGKPMTNFANREYEGSPDTCLQYIVSSTVTFDYLWVWIE